MGFRMLNKPRLDGAVIVTRPGAFPAPHTAPCTVVVGEMSGWTLQVGGDISTCNNEL